MMAVVAALAALAFAPERGWSPPGAPRSFTIEDDRFVKDGLVFPLRSGSLHYFRVPPAYWADRLQRMKALGLNCVTMYVAWNYHEAEEGRVRRLDLVSAFLREAHAQGMLVIFRPGPYICAEWELGGLPAWLLAKRGVRLRTYEPQYIGAVERWWRRLLGVAGAYGYARGGPVVLVQLENEFASYGDCTRVADDARYMNFLLGLAGQYFGGAQLFSTIDGGEGPTAAQLGKGSPWRGDARVLATVDGGLCAQPACYAEKFANQRAFNAAGRSPKMWSELWVGWFTVWGDAQAANKSSAEFFAGVREMVAENASFSLYMAHGGTNFGLWSGANGDQTSEGAASFQPDITSYDYSSPLSEAADHNIGSDGGDLFLAVQRAIGANTSAEQPAIRKVAYGPIPLPESAGMFDALELIGRGKAAVNGTLPSMEELGCWYGLVLYELAGEAFAATRMDFSSRSLHDRVQVFVDGVEVGSAYRAHCPQVVATPSGRRMQLLVENMGRVNYGAGALYDFKGLLTAPPVEGNWTATCIPLQTDHVRALRFTKGERVAGAPYGPIFRRGSLRLDGKAADTFLDTKGFSKGFIWVNGHLLGRYWETAGPQHTLYLPAPFLHTGENEIIVLDLHGAETDELVSTSAPRYHREQP
ncbi:hypothetical protein AB1Y20_008075 [Prymnesium parvum]|uniref:Beta-galactosidase n=1 Tax=Prymnesium parvum TaxID=97485 RepID=A0AB34ISN6_PRYPA